MMESLAHAAHEKGGFNGAWLYAENGEIVSKGALGFCDPADTLPIAENSIFQLASVSKQFTAAAVMLTVRKGLLRLDDEITQYFPEIPYPGVTVRHLLSHTGGVPDYFDDEDWFIRIWQEEKRVPGNDEIPRFLCETKLKPYFAPGERLEYSNTGYNLLALLVERQNGVPYEDFLQQNIFDPVGMTATRCCHIRRDGVPFTNYARATVLDGDRYVADVDSAEYGDVIAFDGVNGDDYVYTNLFDMLKWDRALREGKVLTQEEQRLMYTPAKCSNGEDAVYDEEDGLGYGFGWAVGRDEKLGLIVSHSGGMPGVSTWFERFLDADRVLIYLINREPIDYRAYIGFMNGLCKIARDQTPEPIQTIEEITIPNPDQTRWDRFCGKYEHPADASLCIDEVYRNGDDLYAKALDDDGDPMEFKLYPIGDDTFGRKRGMVKLKFGDGCVTYGEYNCKKI